jgi:tetratricopeptide (TPR) repeat protein
MDRAGRLALPFAVLICSLAGAAQQRRHVPRPIAPAAPTLPAPNTEAIRDNNVGIALMNRQQFQEALGKFQTACIMNPASDTGCLNIGIALLYMKQYEGARNILAKAADRNPANPRAWFNLGLVARSEEQQKDALADFEKVAALDPRDADTQYAIGLIDSESGRDDQAIDAFENAVKLNRFHASAELALAQAEERQGDTDSALAHLNRFRQLLSNDWGYQVSSTYGQQGKYSLAEELRSDPAPVGPAIPVRFIDATAESGLPAKRTAQVTIAARQSVSKRKRAIARTTGTRADPVSSPETPPNSLASFLGSGACVIDYDGDGKPDIFLVNADGRGDAALYRNVGHGKFVDATKAANVVFHGEGTGCAVGDYDNDGRPDIALSSNGRVALYHNAGNGKFEDVTGTAGIHTDGLSLGLTFIDYDRDGHLDLYVTRFNNFPLDNPARPFFFSQDVVPPGNVLWRNKGDGTFENRTTEMALGGTSPSVGALGIDANNDHATDIVLTGWQKSPTILLNQLDGAFQPTNPWASAMPGPAAGAVAMDFDGDCWMDLVFTHWAPPGLTLWRNLHANSFERVLLPEIGWMRGWGVSALDYDNDGRTDIIAVGENFSGEGRIVLLRNEGDKGFRDVTQETGLDKVTLHNPRAVIAFDYDGDGGTDLLITQNDLPPVLLKNMGAQRNSWLQLALKGTLDNKSGIGTEVTLFGGAQRQKWEVAGSSGYLGQNSTEILAGLGDEKRADVMRLRWPRGLLQDELLMRGGQRNAIAETDRSGNSQQPFNGPSAEH